MTYWIENAVRSDKAKGVHVFHVSRKLTAISTFTCTWKYWVIFLNLFAYYVTNDRYIKFKSRACYVQKKIIIWIKKLPHLSIAHSKATRSFLKLLLTYLCFDKGTCYYRKAKRKRIKIDKKIKMLLEFIQCIVEQASTTHFSKCVAWNAFVHRKTPSRHNTTYQVSRYCHSYSQRSHWNKRWIYFSFGFIIFLYQILHLNFSVTNFT